MTYDEEVAACPVPMFHETHHYCPSCPYTSQGDIRPNPERCERCGNYSRICGHSLPFAERMKSIRANYSGWGPTK